MRAFLSALVLVLIASVGLAQEKQKRPYVALTDQKIRTDKQLYRKAAEGELYLHVFYPEGWKASDKRPIIVFFFGGGWKNGSYTQFVPQAEYFASRGIVAACADYRIASKHKTTPDKAVEDARAAIRWVRGNARKLGIDPEKVIGSGGSAGGHLAACTALLDRFDAEGDDKKWSCKPNALVLYNPALNVSEMKMVDGDGKDIAKAISPTLFLKKGTPPALIFFGTADRMLGMGEEYIKKASELGVKAELYTADKQPHGFFNREPWLQVTTKKADEFLTALGYLEGKPTVKIPDKAGELKKASAEEKSAK
jgi:acetyl esterase/lipase